MYCLLQALSSAQKSLHLDPSNKEVNFNFFFAGCCYSFTNHFVLLLLQVHELLPFLSVNRFGKISNGL